MKWNAAHGKWWRCGAAACYDAPSLTHRNGRKPKENTYGHYRHRPRRHPSQGSRHSHRKLPQYGVVFGDAEEQVGNDLWPLRETLFPLRGRSTRTCDALRLACDTAILLERRARSLSECAREEDHGNEGKNIPLNPPSKGDQEGRDRARVDRFVGGAERFRVSILQ